MLYPGEFATRRHGKLVRALLWACAGLLLSAAAALPAMAEGYRQVPKGDIYASKAKRYGHLEYVGFYASAMQHWNYTEELAPFTNLTWIALYREDAIVERLQQARDAGVKAVLAVQPHVFDDTFRLRDDYAYELGTLQARLEEEGLLDVVAMIYPIDEPFLHASRNNTTTRDQMRADLALVNAEIAALFPGTPIGVILNHREIFRDDLVIPESFDWIGMDCYHSLWDCEGRPITAFYSQMLANMAPHQMLMAVPETWVRYDDMERRLFENDEALERRQQRMVRNLNKRLKHHYEIALSEPRFVAFIPFLWSMDAAPGQPDNRGFGVDRFAEQFGERGDSFVRDLVHIGEQIKTGEYVYPNLRLSQTEAHFYRPRNRYEGEILQVSFDGMVSAWGRNAALPHKSLRMQTLVFHNGEEVYRSGIKRSFILDHPEDASWPNPDAVGVHGYRHRLPATLRRELRGKPVEVVVRMRGDRSNKRDYTELRLDTRL